MGNKRGYAVRACMYEAKRIQEAEDLRQKGATADLIAGVIKLSGIPDRFKNCTLESFNINIKNEDAAAASVKLVKQFAEADKSGRGLVLVGPVGTGKTHLAVGILHKLLATGVAAKYVYAPDMIGLLRARATMRNDAGEASLLDITYRELCSERLICFDDIGVDRDTEWTVAQWTRIIDGRYRTLKPSIFTSNLGLEDLERVVGARAMSRLIESNDIVQLAGQDRRTQ